MADFLDQYKVAPATPNSPAQSQEQQDFLKNYAVQSQDQVQSDPRSFLDKFKDEAQSAGVGAVKGAANVYDFALTPLLTDTGLVPADASMRAKAEQYLPQAKDKVTEAGLEGAVSAAPMGPLGAAIGGTTGAATEYLNEKRGHKIENILIPAAASMVVSPMVARQLLKIPEYLLPAGDPLRRARIDQAITAGTPASVSNEDFWYKMQRSLRESTLGTNINKSAERETHQLGDAVNRNAERLAPEMTTQELGSSLQSGLSGGVAATKRAFQAEHASLDHFIDPQTTLVDMTPFVRVAATRLGAGPGHAVPLTGTRTHPGNEIVDRLIEDISQYGNNGQLNLASIKRLKSELGDSLEQNAALNLGDASVRQKRIMYGILADAESQAYAGTPFAARAQALKDAESQFYDTLANYGEKLQAGANTADRAALQPLNEIKLGDTKLNKVLDLVANRPELKDQYASYWMRNAGLNNRGEFDPNRYFREWQKLSPEAKSTLFGPISKDMDQLAVLTENTGRGQRAVNPSQTAGTLHILHELRAFGAIVGAAVGYGMTDHDDDKRNNTGLAHGAAGAGVGAALMSTVGTYGMARMMTNPAFIRWLATPVPVERLPAHIKALSAIAGESPEIAKFQQQLQNNLPQGSDKPKGFAEGGPANENEFTTPKGNNSVLDFFMGGFGKHFGPGSAGGRGNSYQYYKMNQSTDPSDRFGHMYKNTPETVLTDKNPRATGWDFNFKMPEGYEFTKANKNFDPARTEEIYKKLYEDIAKNRENGPYTFGSGSPESGAIMGQKTTTQWGYKMPENLFNQWTTEDPNGPPANNFAEGGAVKPYTRKNSLGETYRYDPETGLDTKISDATTNAIPKTRSTRGAGETPNGGDYTSGPVTGLLDSPFSPDARWKKGSSGVANIGALKAAGDNQTQLTKNQSLIAQFESRFRPYIGTGETDLTPYIESGKVDANGFPLWPGIPTKYGRSTAAGLFQITKSNWDKYAPLVGVHDFSVESQKKVQQAMERDSGMQPWAGATPDGVPFNPKLQAAYRRGEGSERTVALNSSTTNRRSPGQSDKSQPEYQEAKTDNIPTSVIDQFMSSNNEEDENKQLDEKRNKLAQEHVDEVPWAEPLTKYAIAQIWKNANV